MFLLFKSFVSQRIYFLVLKFYLILLLACYYFLALGCLNIIWPLKVFHVNKWNPFTGIYKYKFRLFCASESKKKGMKRMKEK